MVGVTKVEPTRTLAGVAGAVPVPPVPAEYVIHAPSPVATDKPFHFDGVDEVNPVAPGVMYTVGETPAKRLKSLRTVGALPKKLIQRKLDVSEKA